MENMKKMILTLAIVILAVMGYSGSVSAAPVQMPDGNVFDAEFYAQTYPDVVAAFGTDPDMLYMHYVCCGAAEGRMPYSSAPSNPGEMNVAPDYVAKQLQVYSALAVGNRYYEDGRIISPGTIQFLGGWLVRTNTSNAYTAESVYFSAESYAQLNPDIAAIYGTSKEALWNHYKTTGIYEGRLAFATTDNANAKLIAIQVAQHIITPDMTTEEKIRAVHDWMVNNCRYDLNYANVSHSMEGFIYNNTAVCDGYAKTFEYFMSVLDIPCETVTSSTHAWNRVVVDGRWLSIDVCWDDPVGRGDTIRYNYFLISEEQMASVRSHTAIAYYDYY